MSIREDWHRWAFGPWAVDYDVFAIKRPLDDILDRNVRPWPPQRTSRLRLDQRNPMGVKVDGVELSTFCKSWRTGRR